MLDFDKYKNKLPYATKKKDPVVHEAYAEEAARLHELFWVDALAEVDLTDHPKVNKIKSFAWEHGHSCGFNEVMCWLYNLSEFLED